MIKAFVENAMRKQAIQRFVVVLSVAVCAIWAGSAFTYRPDSGKGRDPGFIRKIDRELAKSLETGIRNMYGLP